MKSIEPWDVNDPICETVSWPPPLPSAKVKLASVFNRPSVPVSTSLPEVRLLIVVFPVISVVPFILTLPVISAPVFVTLSLSVLLINICHLILQ